MKSIITVDIKESDLMAQARALFAQEEAMVPTEQTPTEEATIETTPVVAVVEETAVENMEELATEEAAPEVINEATTEEIK